MLICSLDRGYAFVCLALACTGRSATWLFDVESLVVMMVSENACVKITTKSAMTFERIMSI